MKKLITMSILSLCVAAVSAQEQADTLYISLPQGKVVKYAVSDIYGMGFTAVEGPEFPEPDASRTFDKLTPAKSIKTLLTKAGIACTDTLGRINITDEQYDEIKVFTDNLVAGMKTQYEIYEKCYNWVRTNVKYASGYVNNDPYPVFKTKSAICQGYANLLHVMLHTQGVPAMVVNGYMQSGISNGMLFGLGHAWNYVNCDGTWYVSDPTNSGQFEMSKLNTYETWLAATSMDVVLFKEDDCWINFNEAFLNICKVVTEKSVFVAPYSVEDLTITCFNPLEEIPSNVREIYIGENIESLGEGVIGLKDKAPSVEFVAVDPGNKCFVSHAGAVFYSTGYKPTDVYKQIDLNVPAYIPAKLKRLELKAVGNNASGVTYGKMTVSGHKGIEEIVFPKETKSIEGGAIEKCPNLKVAYIPTGVTVSQSAFGGVHADFEIVYTE